MLQFQESAKIKSTQPCRDVQQSLTPAAQLLADRAVQLHNTVIHALRALAQARPNRLKDVVHAQGVELPASLRQLESHHLAHPPGALAKLVGKVLLTVDH